MDKNDPIIRKVLVSTLGVLYGSIFIGDKENPHKIPMLLSSIKDRAWDEDNFIEDKDLCKGFVKGMSKPLPRATIEYDLFQIDLSEYINDNVAVKMIKTRDLEEDETINTRMRFIPVTIPITINVKLGTMNQMFEFSESVLENLTQNISYKINHNGVDNIFVQIIPNQGVSTPKTSDIKMNDEMNVINTNISFNIKFSYPKQILQNYPNSIKKTDVKIDGVSK